MADFKDAGFDQFLNRSLEQTKLEMTEEEAAWRTQQMTGSRISSGVSQSPNKNTIISWDDAYGDFSDGARKRVQVGNIDKTGNYGIRIKDKKGNIRLEFSDVLQQFTMYDSSFNKIIQTDVGGFHGYNTSGNEIVKVDNVGFHAYDASGVKKVKLFTSGAYFYGTQSIRFFVNEAGETANEIKGNIGVITAAIDGIPGLGINAPMAGDYISLTANKDIFILNSDLRIGYWDGLTTYTKFRVDELTGNTTISGTLTVSALTSLVNLTVSNNLVVSGSSVISGTLVVGGVISSGIEINSPWYKASGTLGLTDNAVEAVDHWGNNYYLEFKAGLYVGLHY